MTKLYRLIAQHYIVGCIISVATIMVLDVSCNTSLNVTPAAEVINIPTVVSAPTPTPAPPEGTAKLDVVDISQTSTPISIRTLLLLQICEETSYEAAYAQRPTPATCEVGYLDLEQARFIKLRELDFPVYCPHCARLNWSPDGTRFVYEGLHTIVFRVDGSVEELPSPESEISYVESRADATWSTDGHFIVFHSCSVSEGNFFFDEFTAYDIESHQRTCQVARASLYNPEGKHLSVGHCEGDSQCTLRLKNGNEWRLPNELPSYDQYDSSRSISTRYQVTMEASRRWISVLDKQAGVSTTYTLPRYRITTVALPPD